MPAKRPKAPQRHWYASNHLDPAYGSPLLHQALTASQVEHDVGIVRASAQIEAADAETRRVNIMGQQVGVMGREPMSWASSSRNRARRRGDQQRAVARVKAGEALTAGYVGAATSFLKTAGKLASAGAG
jgi:sRNA-binding protein